MRTGNVTAAVVLGLCIAAQGAPPDGWVAVNVPAVAEHASEARPADGFAWYRCYVKPPANWISAEHERDLWTGSVTLGIDTVHDVYEVYVNGRKVGAAGAMPPAFKAAPIGYRRHNVPIGTLKDGLNVIAVRVYSASDRAGFRGPPPVIAGYDREIVLQGPWEFRAGDDLTWATAGEATPDKSLVYDKDVDQSTPLRRPAELTHGPKLAPAESMKRFQVAEDLVLDQVLAEPTIAQPISMRFDERGRLWIVEYGQYPWPAGIEMKSRDKYYRAVYDREKPPPPYAKDSPFRGLDRVSIHEDTDGDGQYDEHKTFVDGLNITTAVLPVGDGVWVLSPPHLLFYPDADQDDVPDADPQVHLAGFGIEDTHSCSSSLTWGPDGWLYGMQGMTVTTRLSRPGSDQEPIYRQGAMVWRYHPPSGRCEVFAEGGGNAFSLDIDAQGRLLTGHNGGSTRGFDFHQGGYYDKGGSGRFGPMSNPYTFGLLSYMKPDGPIVRFTHAAMIYEGGALPQRYDGKLLGIDPLHSFVVLAERKPEGSTFTTADLFHPLKSDDTSFRPVKLAIGPDGAVYIADFYEHYIAHGQNYSGMLDPTSGRIYRLRARDSQPLAPFDLRRRSTAQLVDLLSHDNVWFRRTALRMLSERKAVDALPQLIELVQKGEDRVALEALWAVNLLGGFDEALAIQTLKHRDPHVRRWAVRLLGDEGSLTPRLAYELAQLAATELDAEVRAQLACTSRRLPTAAGLAIVSALLRHDVDAADSHIPLHLWWSIEARCATDLDAVLALLGSQDTPGVWSRPMVRQHLLGRLMRRFAATGARADLLICARLLEMAPDDAARQALLTGLEEGLAGRTLVAPPEALTEALAKVGGGSIMLRLRQGEPQAIEEALKIIANPSADRVQRRRLAAFFGQVRVDASVPVLLPLAERDPDLMVRQAALSALQTYDQPQIAQRIVELYPALPPQVQPAALALLASRPAWAMRLAQAVDAGHISGSAVPTEIVRQIQLYESDASLQQLVRKLWGRTAAPSTAVNTQRIEQLKGIIDSGPNSPHRGRKLFVQHCGACHRLFDDGGRIGPDLTTYGRDDLDRLLVNIIAPSAEIREGFEHYAVHTLDGRTLSGFLADQDNQVIVLRDLAGQDITLRRDELRQMQPLGRSLMPENTLDALDEQQLRDLFAHLQASQPSPD